MSGSQVGSTMKYLPFGSARSGSVPTERRFTGQRLDSSGLYYYGARYYDADIGRFISADSIIPRSANPQNFARYAYALNNPLRYTDPTGHEELEVAVPQGAFAATAELAVNLGKVVGREFARATNKETEQDINSQLVAAAEAFILVARVEAVRVGTVTFEPVDIGSDGGPPEVGAPQLTPQTVIQVSPNGFAGRALGALGGRAITLNTDTVVTYLDLRSEDYFTGYTSVTALHEKGHGLLQWGGKENFALSYLLNKKEDELEASNFAIQNVERINVNIDIKWEREQQPDWWMNTYEND